MQKRQPTIAVVGGGIAGLAAAYELEKSGLAATVFEAEERIGGRMVSARPHDVTFDQGADFLSENYTTLKQFAFELGVPWEERTGGTLVNRVVRDGIAHPYRLSGLRAVFRLPMLTPPARFALLGWLVRLQAKRRACDFFHLSSSDPRLDGISAHEYLERYVHPEVAVYVADGFTSSMQFHRASEISAGALEAFMHMMVKPSQQFMVRYTPPRIDAIPRALAERCTIRSSTAVTALELTPSGVSLVVHGRAEQFDAAVLATPAGVTQSLLVHRSKALEAVLVGTRYAKTIVVALANSTGILPGDVHMTYVPFEENQLIGGYTNESCKPGVTPKGIRLLNIYLHEEGAEALWSRTDGDILEQVLSQLPAVLPEVRGAVSDLVLHGIKRWERAMPVFSGAHIARVRAYEQSLNQSDRIVLAGDYLNAPWTEGAARSGVRAARLLASRFGMRAQPVRDPGE